MTKETLISFNKVDHSFGDCSVLENISLEIQRGDFVGIIGPNGSGKTTLLKLMLNLYPLKNGEIFLFGKPIHEFDEWWKIGYVPQKATQITSRFSLTVEEVVRMGRVGKRGLFKWFTKEDSKAVHNALQKVDMTEFKKRFIGDLSGGQQQRVFIAKALASDPELLVLDEPTVGVDMESQEVFYTLLSELNVKNGLTIVMVSHDIDVVVNEVSTIICVNKKLVYHGAPKKFIKEDYIDKLYGKGRKFILHGH